MTDEQNPFQSPQANSQEPPASDIVREATRKEWFAALSTAVYISALLYPLICLGGISILKNVIRLSSIGDLSLLMQVGFWAVLSIPSLVVGRMIFNSKTAPSRTRVDKS